MHQVVERQAGAEPPDAQTRMRSTLESFVSQGNADPRLVASARELIERLK